MKKTGIIIGVVAVVCVGAYTFLAQPTLEAELLGIGIDQKAVVIPLGNAGIREIQLVDVTINDSQTPKNAKVQMKENDTGFVLTESIPDSKGYKFIKYDEIDIEPGTSEKDMGNQDSLYGLMVEDDEEINSVTIKYKHLGKEFEKTVTID
jgi:hypothetical protein